MKRLSGVLAVALFLAVPLIAEDGTVTVSGTTAGSIPSNGVVVSVQMKGGLLSCGRTSGGTATQCTASWPIGTVVSVSAHPASGYVQSSWGPSGTACGGQTNGQICKFTVTGPMTVVATFGRSGGNYQ